MEISNELDYEGVRPVTPDNDCIQSVKTVIIQKSQAVQAKQIEVLNMQTEVKKNFFFIELRYIYTFLGGARSGNDILQSLFDK
jgi:hypothetical protein